MSSDQTTMRTLLTVAILFPDVLLAQPPGASTPTPARAKQILLLSAAGLPEGSLMPRRFTCDSTGVSLPLNWSGEPEGTRSFALIMDDPDARNFTHWLLWDVPASVHSLAESSPAAGLSGTNDFGKPGYGPPCPPQGRHVYSIRLFALDVSSLEVKARAHRDALDKAMKKHVLAKAELRLVYGR